MYLPGDNELMTRGTGNNQWWYGGTNDTQGSGDAKTYINQTHK